MAGEARNDKLIVGAASAGTIFEWYDFYLYGSLTAFISVHFFSGVNETTGFILALMAFAAGFAVRPFGAGLLAAAVHLAEDVADAFALRALLDPADVEAGQVAHGEGTHGEAEVIEHPVDIPGHGALHDQLLGFALALAK